MNLTDRRYTTIISAFDNWHDYKSISITLRRAGLACDISQVEFHESIQLLQHAKGSYPDMPLDEAYKKQLVEGVKPHIAPFTNFEQVAERAIKRAPCNGCGGGKVR